jgi:hypothetical protein
METLSYFCYVEPVLSESVWLDVTLSNKGSVTREAK